MDAPFPMHPSYEAARRRARPRLQHRLARPEPRMVSRLVSPARPVDRSGRRAAPAPAPPHADPRGRPRRSCPDVPDRHAPARHGARRCWTRSRRLARSAAAGWWAAQMGESARAADATIVISPFEQGRGRAAARPRSRDGALAARRRRRRALRRAPARRMRRAATLARLARARPAGLGRGDGGVPAASATRERRGARRLLRPATAACPAGADVRRPLPAASSACRCSIRAYARARAAHGRSGTAGHLGRRPRGVGGRAPAQRRRARAASTACSSPAGAATTSCPLGLACADCFVAPSTDEPFGLVYLEAMSCGLPVIGTASGGPPSFVNVVPGEPDGWLVPPDDEAALAEVLVVGGRQRSGASQAGSERTPPRPRAILLATAPQGAWPRSTNPDGPRRTRIDHATPTYCRHAASTPGGRLGSPIGVIVEPRAGELGRPADVPGLVARTADERGAGRHLVAVRTRDSS